MVPLYSALLPRAGEFAVRIDATLMNSVVSGKQLLLTITMKMKAARNGAAAFLWIVECFIFACA